MADSSHSWWKLTFLRKKKSCPKVVYESVVEHAGTEKGAEGNTDDSNYTARLEKIVDKTTKGKHVKVSNSGRFKERNRVRPSLNDNPALYTESPAGQQGQPNSQGIH
ncbi:proline-rich protein 15-like protein [Bombina bombina]|uniref:proline-rich protein 15-like protein n=1 Tax=Bombina bombina TaxID=8345 RepID=UPI00235AC6B3|nr:proline-rich protein 15-like protein [Bombina bombina]